MVYPSKSCPRSRPRPRHVHHVVFRSRGGPDEPWNGVALCVPHHLHGVHMGYLEVTGRAGERLHWRFGTGEAVPLEEWVTLGDDDVRRAGAAGGPRPGDGADFVAEGDTDSGRIRESAGATACA